MKDDTERLFFEHDLATPFTNLNGGCYLLGLYIKDPPPQVAEAVEVIKSSSRTLERMLGWYWRTRMLKESLQFVDPWPLTGLTERLAERIKEEKLPLSTPEGTAGDNRITLPVNEFETALLGVGMTLLAVTRKTPQWEFECDDNECRINWKVDGDKDLIDRDRFFRKVYIPSSEEVVAWLDPGIPYMEVLLAKVNGSIILRWKDSTWHLSARLPT